MIRVHISGWKTGLDTVRAIKEIRTATGCPLDEAMAIVNKVLANEEVHVDLPSDAQATSLVDSLSNLGMITGIVRMTA